MIQSFLSAITEKSTWWHPLTKGEGPPYVVLASLRALVIVGVFCWLLAAPFAPAERRLLFFLLLAFVGYSILLYFLAWKEAVTFKHLNVWVLVTDLTFATLFVRFTGGVGSDFYLAFYLLAALQAFYHGLGRGLAVALSASILYLFSSWPIPSWEAWVSGALRVAFLWLVAVSVGLLSEREQRIMQELKGLNRELQEKKESLEQAYQELEQAQQHLVQSEKLAALGTLSAGLAHEINNPIGIISSRVEVMLLEAKERELLKEVQEDLKVIGKHAARVARIAHGLLSFAKQTAWEFKSLDLNQLVEEVLLLAEKQLSKEGITLEKRLMPGLAKVLGSPNHLEQVLLNLLINAREAMPQGGKLLVETRKARDGHVQLLVADTGVGIPEEARPRLFDPFFTTKERGTGLGLSISYGIIQGHGGAIEVESEVGKGSTFLVTLPAKARVSGGKRDG
ncbi:MAG: hypothetical protein HY347_08520 [candidate division NC10 bacterium]|nr:hypothetical protein [candidate division NC10 bacterium]